MEFDYKNLSDAWINALNVAKKIWTDRSNGKYNGTSCPFCDLVGGKSNGCAECIIHDCYDTPYGLYSSTCSPSKEMEYAELMVKMIDALLDGDIPGIEMYLTYANTHLDELDELDELDDNEDDDGEE
jgi:hypothetical protein